MADKSLHVWPGESYGFWTVLEPDRHAGSSGHRKALCVCACGTLSDVRASLLARNANRSCGRCNAARRKNQSKSNPVFQLSNQDNDLRSINWRIHNGGYLVFGGGGRLKLHRIVLERKIGRSLVEGEIADHINGDTFDCRRENLRVIDPAGSAQNRCFDSYRTKSGKRNVYFNKSTNKWKVVIRFRGQYYHFGAYHDPEVAALVAKEKRKELGYVERGSDDGE